MVQKIFYDTEFHDDGQTIDLISIGLAAANSSRAFYGVNLDADWRRISAHPWLVDNVLPHLPGGWVHPDGELRPAKPTPDQQAEMHVPPLWRPDRTHEDCYTRNELARAVRSFLHRESENEAANRMIDRTGSVPPKITDDQLNWRDLELWAWYGAYDHVALAQLFGPMSQMPPWVPFWTHDLMQLAEAAGIDGSTLKKHVPQTRGEHAALSDALWNERAWRWLEERRQGLAAHGAATGITWAPGFTAADAEVIGAEQLARKFHETYERLAPRHGYETREASAKPWAEVPEDNRALMVNTSAEILRWLEGRRLTPMPSLRGGIRFETTAKLEDDGLALFPLAEQAFEPVLTTTGSEPGRCPTCGSRDPRFHPAFSGGGEVAQICPDAFHGAVRAIPGNGATVGAAQARSVAEAIVGEIGSWGVEQLTASTLADAVGHHWAGYDVLAPDLQKQALDAVRKELYG